jgi:hypothetical protein
LTVSKSGAVHGKAKVGSVKSEGELSGEFDAERIELAGVVKDNTVIRAKSMIVQLSSERGKMQVIFGECELDVGDEPREDESVSDEQAARAEAATPADTAEDKPAEAPAHMDAGQASEASDGSADQEVANAGDGEGKRKKRRKGGQPDSDSENKSNGAEPSSHWSSPPPAHHSEPPPAM